MLTPGARVMISLRPKGGWVITESDFDSLTYPEDCVPVTREEFEAELAVIDQKTEQAEAAKAAEKAALLAQLGITEDQARLLLS